MATNFPGSQDSFTNPTSSDTLDSPDHAAQHTNVNDAVEAIELALLDGAPLHIDDANERVGIGTSSPAVQLQLAGTDDREALRLSGDGGSSGNQGSVFMGLHHWATGTHPSARIGVIETDDADYDASLVFQTRSSDADVVPSTRMTINESGNVGIGTTSPAEELHILKDQDGDLTQVLIENLDQRVRIGSYYEAGVIQYGKIQSEQDAGGDIALALNPEGGNVGIGTTSPSAELDIRGASNPEIRLQSTDSTDPFLYFGDQVDAVRGGIGFDTSANDLIFRRYNNITAMTLTSGGNLGINDTTPSYKLDVAGDIRATGVIQTNTVRDNTGQQLVLEAGEGTGKFSGQTNEFVYTSSESGLAVYTPDGAHPNFQSGYVTRVSELNGEFLKIFDGPTLYQSTASYGTFAVIGYTAGSYYGINLNQDANFMMNTAGTAAGLYWDATNEWLLYSSKGSHTRLHHNGTEKFRTESYGTQSFGYQTQNASVYYHSVCGGTANQIAFRWVNPNLRASIDNVICATAANFSDERIKRNIQSWDEGIGLLRQLRTVTYQPKDIIGFGEVTGSLVEGVDVRDDTLIGLIAQEVGAVIPSAVSGDPEGSNLMSIEHDQMLAVIISAVQDIDTRLTALETA